MSIGAVLAALVVLGRGNIWFAVLLFGLALWLLGRTSTRAGPSSRPGNVVRLRSPTLEFDYDRRTDSMSGSVISGQFRGSPLGALDLAECRRVRAACVSDDPEGARLLEAYLDRRFPGWRAPSDGDGDAGPQSPRGSGGMTEDEAYEVLGLRRDAARDEIVRSHRVVIKKWHPDQGGTADLAARANEAKEVLLRRH